MSNYHSNDSYAGAGAGYNNPDTDGYELGWDDEIEQESQFIVLTPGDYDFVVESVERGYYEPKPGSKLPSCKQAMVTIKVKDAASGQEVSLKENLKMHTKVEWLLSAFFGAVGLKAPGERVKMRWGEVVGRTGRVSIINETGNNGNTYNRIKKWHPYEGPVQQQYQAPQGWQQPQQAAPPQQQATPQQPAQQGWQQQGQGWQSGKF